MPIEPFLGVSPDIDTSVFVADGAAILGDVRIGADSSVWFNTTLRGDVNRITIGRRSNVQDNCCIHVMNQTGPTRIGNEVTVGHSAVLHGCTVYDHVLIGIQATVLDKVVVEPDVIVAAATLVPPGMVLESGWLYMGSPAVKKRKLTLEEIASIGQYAENYVKYSRAWRGVDHYENNPFYRREEP